MAAVVLFHVGFSWAKGGYLGVSTFFTLSGFLITSVLMAEHDGSGSISLRRFWVRRARRLWPASLLTLLGVMVLARFAFAPEEVVGLRGDLFGAVAQVANWRFIVDGRSYGDLFQAPSLVQHFWSLAIEEQMYLFLPLLVVGATRLRNPRRALPGLVAGLIVASMLVSLVLQRGDGADRVYYGTDTRAVELLAGVMLALLARDRPGLGRPRGAAVQVLGWAAAGLTLASWALVPQASEWLGRGGLWLYALLSVALITGGRAPGPLKRLLCWAPLRSLGLISYGVYLFHWPIFQWLSPARLDLPLWAAFALGTAVTVGLASLSYTLLERPVRSGEAHWLGAPPGPAFAALAAFVVVLVAIPTLAPAGRDLIRINEGARSLQEIIDTPEVPVKPGAPSVAFFGDSTALTTVLGTATWARSTGDLRVRTGATRLGCGLISDGERRYAGAADDISETCAGLGAEYTEGARGLDLAVLMAGSWETAAYRLPGSDEFLTIEDEAFRDRLRDELERVHERLTGGGARMAFVIVPDIEVGVRGGRSSATPKPESDPARIERYNDLGRDLAAAHDDVELIDYRGYLQAQPGGQMDRGLRPDGIHLTTDTAITVAEEFLGPALIDLAGR